MGKDTSQIRRVVTGKDETGKAIVLFDSTAGNVINSDVTGVISTLLWVTDSTPASLAGNSDATDQPTGVHPPDGGTIMRVVEFIPEKEIKYDFEARRAGNEAFGIIPEGPQRENPRHPSMHRSKSIDYGFVLSGEIDMLLDDSEVHLKAGDAIVQRGTNHAWVNNGDEPCKIAFVLIDGKD